jgi:uncharacterized RDD family membrane protein YckC
VLLKDRTPLGPFTRKQIQEGLGRGDFTARDLAHTPGLRDWLPLLDVLHHLDREVVHVPRVRAGRSLPPVPGQLNEASTPVVTADAPPAARASRVPLSPLPPVPSVASVEEVGEIAHAAVPPILPPVVIAPTSPARPPSLPVEPLRAPGPLVARLNAFLIDVAILFIPVLVVFAISYATWYARGSFEHQTSEEARQGRLLLFAHLRDLILLVANGFAWLYAAGLESSPWQGTIGKQLTGLVVTDEAGQRIGFIRATGRHAAKYLSALPVFLGFMAALSNPQRLTWHDRLAGTRVTKR